jgi:2-C-methyl-D-erythritol 2,4-cyclodiphosphate synthase
VFLVIRIGQSFDRHPLVPGRPCILAGVSFDEMPVGPFGHSDADVVAHAVIDALLGAAGLADIGTHFPDTDPQYAGADSLELLRRTVVLIEKAGYRIGNVDCTVICEAPKIAPRRHEMRANLAAAMRIPVAQVNVKATRGEGLGPEGRGECITAMAVALVERGD